MKTAMLVLAIALSTQTAAPVRTPLAALVGKWATTAVPREGEAPMIWPSFTLDVKGDVVTVSFEGTLPMTAEVFCEGGLTPAQDVSLLLLKKPATAAPYNVFYMIRPISQGVVRVEHYFEFTDGRAKPNSYYAETFKRAK